MSGTTIAQMLGIAASPLLARLYAPEAFGLVALFTSITGVLGAIACMRYELSIMLPDKDEEAANLLGVCLAFCILVALLTVPPLWWGKEPILRWLNASALAPYLWLVPTLVFLRGVFTGLNYWNSRTKRFGRLSVARVTTSVATTSITLGAGYAGYATGGTMIGANVAGQAVATTVLGGQIWRDDGKLFLRSIRPREMWKGLKRHRKFPLYGTWSVLLNTASWQLPAFLLSAFFSSTVVGYYSLGFRILYMPMSLIGSATAQVFFQRAAAAKTQKSLGSLVENTFRRLTMAGLFPMLMLTIVGRDLYTVVFGHGWTEAGLYAQILSIWAFFWFVSSPMSTLFSVLEKQEFGLKWNLVLFTTRFASLAIGGAFASARLALAIFAVSGTLLYGYLNLSIMAAAGVSWRRSAYVLLDGMRSFWPFGFAQVVVTIACPYARIRVLCAVVLGAGYLLCLAKKGVLLGTLRSTNAG